MAREKLKSSNYFKFVFNKIETELFEKGNSVEPRSSMKLINHLKNSQNLLKDIYLISRVKKLESFAKYLLFMQKKTETGQINFENLLHNMDADKDVLIKIITDNFKTDVPATGRKKWDEVRKNIDLTAREKDSESQKRVKSEQDSENKFRIEELDNELVTEEFIDKDLSEIDHGQKNKQENKKLKHSYLELIKNEEGEEDKKVFSLPGEEPPEEKTIVTADIDEEQRIIPAKKTEPEYTDKKDAVYEFGDLEPKTEEAGEKTAIKEKSPKKEKQKKPDIKQAENNVKQQPGEERPDYGRKEPKFKKRKILIGETLPFTSKKEEKEENKTDATLQEESLTAEEEIKVNTAYLEYESELITRNALMITDLDELTILITSERNEERTDSLIGSIIENATYMEENSIKMSFEIITNIYGIIKLAFLSLLRNEFNITVQKIEVFKNSLRLIESLIKGVDFEGYDNVIKEAEKMKLEIVEKNRQKENLAKMEKDKLELEKHLSKKYSDTTQREKLVLLKQYILEVESIFKSIEGIRSEFQVYEALRKLSSSFVRFREMVNISRILHIKKLAQLSEASYIFVKFLQNYRLSPYDEEVKEIFNFIIYNLKLIFLDKPTKDLDAFISILNDPVQLFSKQKGKKRNE